MQACQILKCINAATIVNFKELPKFHQNDALSIFAKKFSAIDFLFTFQSEHQEGSICVF